LPVSLGLQLSAGRGARINIIDKHHAVADKDIVFNGDAFADKRMRRNLAARADRGVLLHLDEGADFTFVAYLAPVKIDEIWLEDLDSVAQHNVGGNWHEINRCPSAVFNRPGFSARRCLHRISILLVRSKFGRYNRIFVPSTAARTVHPAKKLTG